MTEENSTGSAEYKEKKFPFCPTQRENCQLKKKGDNWEEKLLNKWISLVFEGSELLKIQLPLEKLQEKS